MNKPLSGINAQQHSMSLQIQSDSLEMEQQSLKQSLSDVPAFGRQLFIFIKQIPIQDDRNLISVCGFRVAFSQNEWD